MVTPGLAGSVLLLQIVNSSGTVEESSERERGWCGEACSGVISELELNINDMLTRIINYVLIEKLITIRQIESWTGQSVSGELMSAEVWSDNHHVDNQTRGGEIIRAV